VFPHGTDFHKDALYKNGSVIIQDKASCFPAFILDPPPGAQVIDACAAPGNKTSFMAMCMENKGHVWAFEKDPRRYKTLETMMELAGATVVQPVLGDFLRVNPGEFAQVEYILLDPSCSGSGIVNRLDQLAAQAVDEVDTNQEERLESLAAFQLTALRHAFTFPGTKRITYSTCSVHEQENEQVVVKALASTTDFCLDHVLPAWKNRGHTIEGLTAEQARCLVRCDSETDDTNGFFVACFIRK
jgi:putative methyltransferase